MLSDSQTTDNPAVDGALLVLGLGNALMSDDGIGPRAIAALAARRAPSGVRFLDGGTCGLALLPEIERCAGLIVIDAFADGAAPGTVSVHEGAAMDAALRGVKSTAHEVALADLMDAAHVTVGRPARRALIGVAPARVAVGLEPTPAVAATLPAILTATDALIAQWTSEGAET
jgi:hydrogenase maturation protease